MIELPQLDIPCDGCIACCTQYQAIAIMRGRDDDRLFKKLGRDHRTTAILPHKSNGDCVFLNDERNGCSVHSYRPTICRVYNCIDDLKKHPKRVTGPIKKAARKAKKRMNK